MRHQNIYNKFSQQLESTRSKNISLLQAIQQQSQTDELTAMQNLTSQVIILQSWGCKN